MLAAVVTALAGLHLALASCMRLCNFSPVCLANLMLVVPFAPRQAAPVAAANASPPRRSTAAAVVATATAAAAASRMLTALGALMATLHEVAIPSALLCLTVTHSLATLGPGYACVRVRVTTHERAPAEMAARGNGISLS